MPKCTKNYNRLDESKKKEIIFLFKQGLKKKDIAKQYKCHPSTITRFLKQWEETGQVKKRTYPGRPRLLNSREEAHLKRICLKDRFTSASKLKEELSEVLEKPCSTRTVQRRLNDMGLTSCRPAKKPLLTKKMRLSRLNWCKKYGSWTQEQWNSVIFSDESKINLIGADGGQRVRRRTGERFAEKCVQHTVKHSPYIMVWGAITYTGVGVLMMLEGSVNAQKYKCIIKDGVIPTIEQLNEHYANVVFQDDSAPCHRAISIKNYKEELGISSLEWPGNSPDLNPIENVWSIMKRKVRQKEPRTLIDLKQIISEVWYNEITTSYLEKLYLSMPKRLKDVIKQKGGHINK